MEEYCGIDPNLPEVEIVYELLKASKNESRKLRDLLQQAFIIKGLPLDDHQGCSTYGDNSGSSFYLDGPGQLGFKRVEPKEKLSDVLSPESRYTYLSVSSPFLIGRNRR